jgi:pimeloyl-ACP methyl ester carboxylesterase
MDAMTQLETLDIEARGLHFPALACGTGPLVLCLHGFPDCHRSFRHQLPALARAGYRAVAPALRGYAPECQTGLDDTHALAAADDAIAMVHALGEDRAHLVGHDWGAVATYLAGARAPDTFRSLTTLAVPHPLGIAMNLHRYPMQLRLSWYMLFFQLRGVAERKLRADDFALIERLFRDWSPSFRLEASEMRAIKDVFAAPGVVEAALAYYRQLLDFSADSFHAAQKSLRTPIETPLLALTGAEDGCLMTELYDVAMDERFMKRVVVERMLGVGHFLHQEEPERVNARLIAWLREHD